MMAQYLNDDLEYVVEDYDMAEFDDEEVGENEQQNNASQAFHLEGNTASKQKTDTSAIEFQNGKDMQGIPWEKLNYSRLEYRKMRLKQYKNYENLYRSREALEKECKNIETKGTFFDFQLNTRSVKSTIAHFQYAHQLYKIFQYLAFSLCIMVLVIVIGGQGFWHLSITGHIFFDYFSLVDLSYLVLLVPYTAGHLHSTV